MLCNAVNSVSLNRSHVALQKFTLRGRVIRKCRRPSRKAEGCGWDLCQIGIGLVEIPIDLRFIADRWGGFALMWVPNLSDAAPNGIRPIANVHAHNSLAETIIATRQLEGRVEVTQ